MYIWATDLFRYGSKNGIIVELDDGTLLNGSANNFTVNRSTDKGMTWTSVYVGASGRVLMNYVAKNGTVFFGSNRLGGIGDKGQVIRSTDNGLTWSLVLTVDSGAVWRMTEDLSGNLYVAEYSAGAGDSTELYGYNVWKSTNNGATWAKWHQHAQQSTPGARDEMRHIHELYSDKDGQLYISYGDYPGYGGDAGKNFKLNTNGTLGQYMGLFGNGVIAFVQAANGNIILGGDAAPKTIYAYDKVANTKTDKLVLPTAYGAKFDGPIYELVRGKDDVLYGQVNAEGAGVVGAIVASADNGETWHLLDIQNNWGGGTHLYLNRNRPEPRLYISRVTDTYVSFPDMKKSELNSYVSRSARRQVDWYSRGL